MTNFPTVPEIIDQLRQHKIKSSLNNTTLAAQMAAWGWGTSTWSAVHVTALMNGTVQPTEDEIEFIQRFLLNRFYVYNCT